MAASDDELCRKVAVAVSGGADSMALLLLTRARGHSITALTVDHGLRPEAAAEAAQVAKWCADLGIEHHTLTANLTGKKTQETARNARYRLLTDYCKRHHIPTLLTAHHRDDQVETLFMRLARGSFIDGLACMAPLSTMHGVALARPLLDMPKTELIAYVQAQGQPWIEDPSNRNPRYTRTRLRQLLTDESLKSRACAVIDSFARIRRIMDAEVEKALAACVKERGGHSVLSTPDFRALPPEIALRVLSRLIVQLTHDEHPPRTEKLLRLLKTIREEGLTTKRTLAGLIFSPLKKEDVIHIYPEEKA